MENQNINVISPQVLHLITSDPEEISDLVPTWDQEYLQLKRGQFAWEGTAIHIGDFQFLEELLGMSTLVRGQIPEGTVAIGLPHNPLGADYYLGHEVTAQTFMKGHHSHPFDLKINQQLGYIIMVVPINCVLKFAEQTQQPFREQELLSPGIVIPEFAAYQNLAFYLKELLVLLKAHPEKLTASTTGPSLAQIIIADSLPLFMDVLTSEASTNLSENDSNYRRLAKKAEQFAYEHIEDPITLQQLCENLQTNQRSLNYAFQAVYGVAPMDYLKILRLNQARHALRSADPKISRVMEIAGRFGFWHMGQFSGDYKRMFGETPSTTLKRR